MALALFVGEENAGLPGLGCMEPEDGHLLRQGLLDDLRGAAPARGRLAVPDGNQQIGLLQDHTPDALVGDVGLGVRAIDLKDRRGFGEKRVELVAGGVVFEVAAVLGGVKGEGALQIGAGGKSGAGDDAVRALGQRREDAQERRLGRIETAIVRGGDQMGDGLQRSARIGRGERRRPAAKAGWADGR